MPYKDKEKQKAYQREYRKKERQILKELRAKQKAALDGQNLTEGKKE